MKEGYCKAEAGRGWIFFQCSRKAWKDGWCKQHHPDIMEEKQRERNEVYKRKNVQDGHPEADKFVKEMIDATYSALEKYRGDR